MDANQIEMRFLNELRSTRGHRTFTANSALDLVFQIQTAANRMVVEDRTSEKDLAEATKAFAVFLDEMDTVRATLGYSEFREETISGAIVKLCPGFWPFC